MEAQKKAFTHSAGQDMSMSLDQRSLLSEQTGFPAECVVCRVYLRVTTDALQSDIKLRFILRTVWTLKTIPGRPGWPGGSDGRRMLSPPRARAAVRALEGLVSRSLCQTCMPSAWQRSCATSAPVSGGFRYGRAELGWFEGQPLIILSKKTVILL